MKQIITIIAVLLICGTALGQENTEEVNIAMSNIDIIIGVIIAILTAFGIWDKLDEYVDQKTTKEMHKLYSMAKSAVIESYDKYEEEMIKARKDGIVTKKEFDEAWLETKKEAIDKFKKFIKEEGINVASSIIPELIEKAVDYFKSKKIEEIKEINKIKE